MRGRVLLSYLFLIFLIALSFHSEAQRGNKYKKQKQNNRKFSHYKGGSVGGRFRPYQFVSFNVNALNYFGDLAPVNRAASTDVSFTRPGMGVNVGYKFSAYSAIRAGFNYGRLKGDDFTSDPGEEQNLPRYTRNLSFRNDIKEFHMGFEFYFFPNHGGPNVRPNLNFYLFVGGAIFHHEPKGLVPELDFTTGGTEAVPQAGDWVKLRKLGTEGQFLEDSNVKPYSPIQASIPVAIGVKLKLPGPFDAGFEMGYRYLFTDYIDDASTNYVGFDKLSDPLARIMSDRSAEPVAAWAGVERTSIQVVSQTLGDGNNYYSAGGAYGIGGGISEGAIRGNPKDKDMIFMSTIKLTYILGKTRSSAKFR